MVAKKKSEAEKTPTEEENTSITEVLPDNIAIHQKTLREQLMTQWPNSDWEIR